MTNLIERLREGVVVLDTVAPGMSSGGIDDGATDELMTKAAEEIERLQAQVAQMHGMAREGCEAPNTAYRWCERIDDVGFHGASDEYIDYTFKRM